MKCVLQLSFDDENGIRCSACMLSVAKGERTICSALGMRPLCPEEGKRKDCPLVQADERS